MVNIYACMEMANKIEGIPLHKRYLRTVIAGTECQKVRYRESHLTALRSANTGLLFGVRVKSRAARFGSRRISARDTFAVHSSKNEKVDFECTAKWTQRIRGRTLRNMENIGTFRFSNRRGIYHGRRRRPKSVRNTGRWSGVGNWFLIWVREDDCGADPTFERLLARGRRLANSINAELGRKNNIVFVGYGWSSRTAAVIVECDFEPSDQDDAKEMTCKAVCNVWILLIFFILIPTMSSKNSTQSDSSKPDRVIRYPCQCVEGECGCCTGNILSNFNINMQNRACANVTYYPEDFEFHLRFIFNDVVFFQRRMSGKNPRPLCAALPYVGTIKMCIVFSNIYVAGRNLHMCMSIDFKFRENTIYSFSFDCIRVGTGGVAWLSPEAGGGLGPPKPVIDNVTVGEDYDAIVASEGDDIQSA